jgi:hypothetical protein
MQISMNFGRLLKLEFNMEIETKFYKKYMACGLNLDSWPKWQMGRM